MKSMKCHEMDIEFRALVERLQNFAWSLSTFLLKLMNALLSHGPIIIVGFD